MSSRVFRATTGHTIENPQLCGLSNREIQEDDQIMYLVCHGGDARPEYQIKVTREEKKEKTYRGRTRTVYERDYGMDDGRTFRSVFGGWQVNHDTGKREKVFNWQELKGTDSDGEEIWSPVKCWSNVVLAEVADELGYAVRRKKNGKWQTTTAHDGDRTVGNEHTIDAEGENAMEVLARAVCSDEELGLVAPKEPEIEEIIRDENESLSEAMNAEAEAEEERLDAEAMGMTVEQWRKALARNA